MKDISMVVFCICYMVYIVVECFVIVYVEGLLELNVMVFFVVVS